MWLTNCQVVDVVTGSIRPSAAVEIQGGRITRVLTSPPEPPTAATESYDLGGRFLLPGLINFFRWLARKSVMTEDAAKWVGVPASILITSAAFAYMHSPQVSHAWGPLVLIGTVSLILCIVRLAMNSVAAGVIVHAAYNLTLFAGILAQTGGFRHLDRLTT